MGKPRPRTRRVGRLGAGALVLLTFGYGTVVATAPAVIAPITTWMPVELPESRSGPDKPEATPVATPAPTKAPRPSQAPLTIPRPIVHASSGPVMRPGTAHSIRGNASWFCRAGVSSCTRTHPDSAQFDAYAAAGPRLRAAIGPNWRGMIVMVDGTPVRLIDWCQCYKGRSNEKLLDLYFDVWEKVGGNVTVRW